jgi:hypothetical protein
MLFNSILHAHNPKKLHFRDFGYFGGIFGAILARKWVKNQFWAKQKNIPLEIPLRIQKKNKKIGMNYDWGPWSLE